MKPDKCVYCGMTAYTNQICGSSKNPAGGLKYHKTFSEKREEEIREYEEEELER